MDILEEILSRLDLQKLFGYGVDYHVGTVIKRLGWWLERLGVAQALLTPLLQVPVHNKILLAPRAPASAIVNKRWQIIENLRRA